MRFLCIYRPGTPERHTPPSQDEMAKMGQLIGEMAKAGVLLAAEGCLPSSMGARRAAACAAEAVARRR